MGLAERLPEKSIGLMILGEPGRGFPTPWTLEARKLIFSHFDSSLAIQEIADPSELPKSMRSLDGFIVVYQANTPTELKKASEIIQQLKEPLKSGTAILVLITRASTNSQVEAFERKGLLQVLPPNLTPKALKIKIEYFASRIQTILNKKNSRPADDFVYLAENSRNTDDLTLEKEPANAPSVVIPFPSPAASEPSLQDTPPTEPAIEGDHHDHMMLLSSRPEDLVYAAELARGLQTHFHVYNQIGPDVKNFLDLYDNTVVVWDVDHSQAQDSKSHDSVENIGLILNRATRPGHVFAISDQPVTKNPKLFNYRKHVFNHSMLRRDNPTAKAIYIELIDAALQPEPVRLDDFFKEGSGRQEIRLTKSNQRSAAIEATLNYLIQEKLPRRLSTQIAEAADELLLNALFRAPYDPAKKMHYRTHLDLESQFTLSSQEEVSLAVMSNELYFGMSVRDHFGSMKIEKVLHHLWRDLTQEKLGPSEHGIGLKKILQAGFSVMISVDPKKSTEVMIFFPRAKTHKEFKSLFQFFSARFY